MTDQLKSITTQQCESPPATYDDLNVLMLNCTLTRSPKVSHTEDLLKMAAGIYQANGVKTEIIRPVDYEIAAGLEKDYTGRAGYAKDDFPRLEHAVHSPEHKR